MSEPSASSRRPSPLLIGAMIGALVVVALGVVWPRLLRSGNLDPEAQWIWAPLSRIDGRPTAFVAVRDFELSEEPRGATLRIQADEEYVLRVNGVWVGAGGMERGRVADAYAVGDLLRPGANRLLVDLRSARGVGAFFLSLVRDEWERVLVRTDADWWVFWQYRKALDDLTSPIEKGANPHLWGRPPAGRWLGPREVVERPRLDRLRLGEPRLPSEVFQWVGGRRLRRPARRARNLGRQVLFVWPEPVTGYLALSSRSTESSPAVVYFGLDAAPDPILQAPGATRIQLPGRRHWTDSRLRTFRYALVIGSTDLLGAHVVEVDATSRGLPVSGLGPIPGVFGLEPPRLRTTVENEIWSDLEGLEGQTGSEVD